MTRLPYALLEVATLILFLWTARSAWRQGGRPRLLELLSAVPYGLLLEQGDITLFGSYAYNQLFFVKLGYVPLAIALGWAMIIYSCMYLSDAIGTPARLAPFSDAVFAIILDLSFDAVAIRQGLWHWNIPLDAGFLGVPAGNFYSWLFVAVGFSAWTRWVRRQSSHRPAWGWAQLAVPVPAYLTLLLAFSPFVVLKSRFFPQPGAGLPLFFLTLAVFVGIAFRRKRPRAVALVRPWQMPLLPRLAMHLYFIGVVLALGLYRTAPALLVISLAMFAFDLGITLRALAARPQARRIAA
jgi:uncharacterized membrane protein